MPHRKLRYVRLDLMPAITSPDDQPQLGLRRIAERHRPVGSDFIGAQSGRGMGAPIIRISGDFWTRA